jgi:hypothetical protein
LKTGIETSDLDAATDYLGLEAEKDYCRLIDSYKNRIIKYTEAQRRI